jgi:NTE family protein
LFAANSFSQKIGVCLSGGGALGYAEIGALKALEEAGIVPNVVSGCSMGSIVGVFYAAGYSPDSLWSIIQDEKMTKFIRMFNMNSGDKTGFSQHKMLRKMLDKYIDTDDFDSLQKKLYVCVADFKKGESLYANSGKYLKDYVVASGSIPIAFESIEIDGRELVDGGVLNNFPVEPLMEEGCDIIIGIDVVIFTPYEKTIRKKKRINTVFALLIESQTRHKHQLCDLYVPIAGMNTPNNGVINFEKAQENYDKGYQQMKDAINEFKSRDSRLRGNDQ